MKLRIATYNVEDLFRRSAILNLKDHVAGTSSTVLAK